MYIDYDAFRKNLSTLISTRGFSITKFAESVEIPTATISRYLSGQRTPDIDYVAKFADYFGVTIDWLLGRSSDRYEQIPQDISELVKLYSISSQDDKDVIQAILKKYRQFL